MKAFLVNDRSHNNKCVFVSRLMHVQSIKVSDEASIWECLFVECIQEGLWRHSTWRLFVFNFGLEKEAKSRLSFWYPTGFLNTFNLFGCFKLMYLKWRINLYKFKVKYEYFIFSEQLNCTKLH